MGKYKCKGGNNIKSSPPLESQMRDYNHSISIHFKHLCKEDPPPLGEKTEIQIDGEQESYSIVV